MNLATLQEQFAKALHYEASGEECEIESNLFSADERMQIYRNNFIISLSEVLSATYPMVETLLGKECFAQIARQHVLTHPLTEGQVAHYGRGFPNTLAIFDRVTEQAPYAADVAHFEWEVDISRQAQREQRPNAELTPLTQLADVDIKQQAELIFHLHSACRSFYSNYAVFDLFTAIQDQEFEHLDINQRQRGVILVNRSGRVLCHALDLQAFQLLLCLEQKQPLGNIAQPALNKLSQLMLLGMIEGFTLQQSERMD